MKLIKASAIALALSTAVISPVYAAEKTEVETLTENSIEETKEEPTIEETKEEPTIEEQPTEEQTEETVENNDDTNNENEQEPKEKQVLSEDDTAINMVIPRYDAANLSEERNKKKEELEELKKQLSDIDTKLAGFDTRASELSEEMFETQKNLATAKETYNKQYDDMKMRIQYMYENNDTNVSDTFITSKDMGDVLRNIAYYQTIHDYDRTKLNELEDTYIEINEYNEKLEKDSAELEELKQKTTEEQEKLKKLVDEKKEEISLLENDIIDASNYSLQSQVLGGGNSAATEILLNRAKEAQEQALKDGTATALQVRVAQNAGNGNSTFPPLYNWCAAWVSGVYGYTGITPPHGDAIEYWNKWNASGSSDYTTTPIGAAVISSSHPTYGHIGIYLGGGVVASNLGYVKIETIESFGSTRTVCQGKQGFVGWVWPNNIDLSKSTN